MTVHYYYWPNHDVYGAIYDDEETADNVRLFRDEGLTIRIDHRMSPNEIVEVVASHSVEIVPKHVNWQFRSRRK